MAHNILCEGRPTNRVKGAERSLQFAIFLELQYEAITFYVKTVTRDS